MKQEIDFTEQLKSTQSGNETSLVYVILQKIKFYQKIYKKMWPGKYFQALLCL